MSAKKLIKNHTRLRCVCGHDWVYQGSKLKFACCPSCRSTISIKKNRIIDENNREGGETD